MQKLIMFCKRLVVPRVHSRSPVRGNLCLALDGSAFVTNVIFTAKSCFRWESASSFNALCFLQVVSDELDAGSSGQQQYHLPLAMVTITAIEVTPSVGMD